MRLHTLYLSAVIALSFTCQAQAGAWTQDAGKGQFIMSSNYYTSTEYYDEQGHKQPESHFQKIELNPYLEYGLWDGLTAGANLSLPRVMQKNTDGMGSVTHSGLGDSEFFVRKRLWQNNGWVVSAEPMVKLPSPASQNPAPSIGSHHPDLGLGLSAGYSFSYGGQTHFIDLGTQYRDRLGPSHDQAKMSATLGIGITEQWMILPQAFLTYRLAHSPAASFTQSPSDDYNVTRLELSTLYKLTRDISVQLGGFSDISGKNTGVGNGVVFSLWKTL